MMNVCRFLLVVSIMNVFLSLPGILSASDIPGKILWPNKHPLKKEFFILDQGKWKIKDNELIQGDAFISSDKTWARIQNAGDRRYVTPPSTWQRAFLNTDIDNIPNFTLSFNLEHPKEDAKKEFGVLLGANGDSGFYKILCSGDNKLWRFFRYSNNRIYQIAPPLPVVKSEGVISVRRDNEAGYIEIKFPSGEKRIINDTKIKGGKIGFFSKGAKVRIKNPLLKCREQISMRTESDAFIALKTKDIELFLKTFFLKKQSGVFKIKVLDWTGKILSEKKYPFTAKKGNDATTVLIDIPVDEGLLLLEVEWIIDGRPLLIASGISVKIRRQKPIAKQTVRLTEENVSKPEAVILGATVAGHDMQHPVNGPRQKLQAEAIKKYGGNTGYIVFEWRKFEYKEGCFDFAKYDKALNMLENLGLSAYLSAGMISGAPEWFIKKFNEDNLNNKGQAQFCRRSGKSLPGFPGHYPDPWGSNFRQYFFRYLDKLLSYSKQNKNIIGFNLFAGETEIGFYPDFSENSIYGYSEISRKKFIDYLAFIKGYSLQDLSRIFEKPLNSFNDIEIPAPPKGNINKLSRAWVEFQSFREWSEISFCEDTLKRIRKADSDIQITLAAHARGDEESMLELMKRYGAHQNVSSAEPPAVGLYHGSLARQHGVRIHWEPGHTPPNHYDISASFMNFFLYGGKAFIWISGMIDAAPETLKVFRNVGADGLSEISSLDVLPIDSNMIVSHDSDVFVSGRHLHQIWLHQYAWNLANALSFSHLPAGVVTDRTSYEKIPGKLLIDTNSRVLPDGFSCKVTDFVKEGGHLLISSQSGAYSTDSCAKDYFLIKKLGFETEKGMERNWKKSVHCQFNWEKYTGKLVLKNCSVLPDFGKEARVVAKNEEGKTVAVLKPYGNGEVLLMGGMPDWKSEESITFLTALHSWAGCRKYIDAPRALRAGVRRKNNVYYVGLFNEKGMQVSASNVRLNVREMAGVTYQVFDITDEFDMEIGSITGDALIERGMNMNLAANELKILKFIPESNNSWWNVFNWIFE